MIQTQLITQTHVIFVQHTFKPISSPTAERLGRDQEHELEEADEVQQQQQEHETGEADLMGEVMAELKEEERNVQEPPPKSAPNNAMKFVS